MFYPARLKSPQVNADNVLLVIEVSDTTLSYDLKIKAPIFSSHGVAEYWVIDADLLQTHVHRKPTAGGYEVIEIVERYGQLTAPFGLTFSLGDLDLEWDDTNADDAPATP